MKFQDYDMSEVQKAIDAVNDQGCTYASLQITCTGKTVNFKMYTPETGHQDFKDVESLTDYLKQIASDGEGAMSVMLAKRKIEQARESIELANEDIANAEAVLARQSTDYDEVSQ